MARVIERLENLEERVGNLEEKIGEDLDEKEEEDKTIIDKFREDIQEIRHELGLDPHARPKYD